jgi:hypothetical protein
MVPEILAIEIYPFTDITCQREDHFVASYPLFRCLYPTAVLPVH